MYNRYIESTLVVVMLEEFEQTKKDPCQCGGNCGCGGNKSVNEAKKYKFKDLAKAWEFVYGEDMEDEYQGFYQEVTGKYKNKVTKADIAEIWNKVYGEDIEAEYDGFYNELKENLNEANKLEAAARKEIIQQALEPYIEYYGDTYQHGGFFDNKLVKRQVEDLMGKDWWDDFSSAYAQQSPESEDGEGESDQTGEALGMTLMPKNDPVITLPPQDVKFEEAEALPEETIALVEESMSDELKQGYTAKYTRAQWDDMTRKERRERGLPESPLGAMGFAFRDDIDQLPAVKNAAIMRDMNKDTYKIRIRGRGTYHVTKEQLESMTRGAFLAGEPAVEIMEYDEGEKKAKNIPSTLLKRYQVGE